MKNSAWYHKLWRDRLNELPLKRNQDAAWADMDKLLDQQLPIAELPINNNWYALAKATNIKVLIAFLIASTIAVTVVIYNPKHNAALSKKQKPNNHIVEHKNTNQAINRRSGDSNKSISADHYPIDLSNTSTQTNAKDDLINAAINNKKTPLADLVNWDLNMIDLNRIIEQGKILTPSTKLKPINKSAPSRSSNSSIIPILTPAYNSSKQQAINHKHKSRRQLIQNKSVTYTTHHAAKKAYVENQIGSDKLSESERYSISAKRLAIVNGTSNATTAKSDKASRSENDKESADTKIDPVKSQPNSTNTQEGKKTGARSRAFNASPSTVKTKEDKSKSKAKKSRANDTPPQYNYGMEAGLNAGKGNSLYFGIIGSVQVKPHWLINAGLRLNTYKNVSGEYNHSAFNNPDSIPPFKITDSRKVMALTIPLRLEYKLTKSISLMAGPVINLQINQSNISSKLGVVPNIRDTLYHTKTIDSALKKTTINKLNAGFTGGVRIQIKHFSIEGMYQMLTPYKVSSGLGSYKSSNQNFQIGIGYRFKQ